MFCVYFDALIYFGVPVRLSCCSGSPRGHTFAFLGVPRPTTRRQRSHEAIREGPPFGRDERVFLLVYLAPPCSFEHVGNDHVSMEDVLFFLRIGNAYASGETPVPSSARLPLVVSSRVFGQARLVFSWPPPLGYDIQLDFFAPHRDCALCRSTGSPSGTQAFFCFCAFACIGWTEASGFGRSAVLLFHIADPLQHTSVAAGAASPLTWRQIWSPSPSVAGFRTTSYYSFVFS